MNRYIRCFGLVACMVHTLLRGEAILDAMILGDLKKDITVEYVVHESHRKKSKCNQVKINAGGGKYVNTYFNDISPRNRADFSLEEASLKIYHVSNKQDFITLGISLAKNKRIGCNYVNVEVSCRINIYKGVTSEQDNPLTPSYSYNTIACGECFNSDLPLIVTCSIQCDASDDAGKIIDVKVNNMSVNVATETDKSTYLSILDQSIQENNNNSNEYMYTLFPSDSICLEKPKKPIYFPVPGFIDMQA